MAAIIQRLGDGAVAGAPGGAPGAPGGAFTVLVDPRANALIVRAANPVRMAQVRALIQRLDQAQPGVGAAGNIWVVHLKNADATKLATVLRAAFTPGSGASVSGVAQATGLHGGADRSRPGRGRGTAGAPRRPRRRWAPRRSRAPAASSRPTRRSNSLIITAPAPLYRQVRAMIEQLDTRRAQIYIESLIVEVSGDNAADFGFQWQGLIGQNGDKLRPVRRHQLHGRRPEHHRPVADASPRRRHHLARARA